MFLKKKKRCCILWRCGVDGWVRVVVDSTYGWLDGCVRAATAAAAENKESRKVNTKVCKILDTTSIMLLKIET